jgi:hypothetical protein
VRDAIAETYPQWFSDFNAKLKKPGGFYRANNRSILAHLPLWACNLPPHAAFAMQRISEFQMSQESLVQEHMDVISSDRKTVGKVDHLDGPDKIKLTKQSSPNGEHHHFIPVSWIDHVDQHVHLNKTGADVTAQWEHEGQV